MKKNRKLFTIRLDPNTIARLKKIEGSKTEFIEKAILSRLEWMERKEALEKTGSLDPKVEAIIKAAQKKWNEEKKGS